MLDFLLCIYLSMYSLFIKDQVGCVLRLENQAGDFNSEMRFIPNHISLILSLNLIKQIFLKIKKTRVETANQIPALMLTRKGSRFI